MEDTLLFKDPTAEMHKQKPSFMTAYENNYNGLMPGMPATSQMSQSTVVQNGNGKKRGGADMFLPEGYDQPINQTPFGPRIWRK